MSHPPLPARLSIEPDLTGRLLGNYQVLRRLGRGAMAEVYLAEQVTLKRSVAIKVLKRHLAADDSYVRRFKLEAQAAAGLVHANIVQIYEVGRAEQIDFIAQEYVPGQNLAERLSKQGPLEVPVAVAVICQVAAALAKAAEQGVVHRDIKPENIMLANGGEVKVADFGLARVVDHADGMHLTQAGVTMGTPLYMSPEQVEGRPLDPRSDIYSLGVTAYQMLAGRTPFRGESALSIAVQHLQTEPQRLENLRPDLPAGLCRVIHRMLQKSPDQRYQSAREVLADLRELPVDGLVESWPKELDALASQDIVAASQARHAATQQLETIMRSAPREMRPLWRRGGFLAAIAGMIAFGAAAAYLTREPPLLSGASAEATGIERLENAEQQYLYALATRSEEAYQSVLQYFPDDPRFSLLAKRELARLYLDNDRLPEAMSLFTELSRLSESEPEYRAFGLAGQYIVYSLEGEPTAAAAKLSELWPLIDRLDDRMYHLVQLVLSESPRTGDAERNQEIERRLRELELGG